MLRVISNLLCFFIRILGNCGSLLLISSCTNILYIYVYVYMGIYGWGYMDGDFFDIWVIFYGMYIYEVVRLRRELC